MRHDPTDDHRRYYKCRDCGHRTIVAAYRARCPACGGPFINIAVPRE